MKKSIRILFVFFLLLGLAFYACAPSSVVSVFPKTDNDPAPKETVVIKTPDLPTGAPVTAPHDTFLPSPSAAPAEPPARNTDTPLVTEPPYETPEPEKTAAPTPAPSEKPFIAGKNNVVYLTFDDGPCSLTPQLLDILDKYNIKATFFTVGFFVERHPEIVREAASRGHLIACHTYSHDFKTIYKSADAFMDDVHKWETAVIKALGALPEKRCVRFPGGSRNSYLDKALRPQITARLEAEGYCRYDWNFGDNDRWLAGNKQGLPKEEYLMRSYKTTLRWAAAGDKPLIFLAHDTSLDTLKVIDGIIRDLRAGGFVFATLEDCPFPYFEM